MTRTRGSRRPRPARAGPPSCTSGSAVCCSRTASRWPRSAHFERALRLEPGAADVEYAIGQSLVDGEALQGRHPSPGDGAPRRRAAQPGGLRPRARPRRAPAIAPARCRRSRGSARRTPRTRQLERARRARDAAAVAVAGGGVLQRGDRGRAARAKPHQDMGRALAMMGRRQEAIAQFEQGVALEPGGSRRAARSRRGAGGDRAQSRCPHARAGRPAAESLTTRARGSCSGV